MVDGEQKLDDNLRCSAQLGRENQGMSLRSNRVAQGEPEDDVDGKVR